MAASRSFSCAFGAFEMNRAMLDADENREPSYNSDSHPERVRELSSCFENLPTSVSRPYVTISNLVPAKRFNSSEIRRSCSPVIILGASRVSSVMIFDCWTSLIPPSTVNSATLKSVSATIPHSTNLSATLRTSSGPCSQTIPHPTAIVASTSPSNKFQRTADEKLSLLASASKIAVHIFPLLLAFCMFGRATFDLVRSEQFRALMRLVTTPAPAAPAFPALRKASRFCLQDLRRCGGPLSPWRRSRASTRPCR